MLSSLRRIAIVWWLILVCAQVYPQTQQGYVRFDERNGLNASQIYQLSQDRYRNLWILTFNGSIIRFNGESFKHFHLDDEVFTNNLFAIAVSPSDTTWILSDRGLLAFDGKQFSLIDPLQDFALSYFARLYIDPAGRLWMMDGTGCIWVRDKSLRKLTNISSAIGVFFDNELTEIWTSNQELIRLNLNLEELSRVRHSLPRKLKYAIKNPQQRNGYVLFDSTGIFRLSDSKILSLTSSLPFNTSRIGRASFDAFGNLFIISQSHFYMLDLAGNWVNQYRDFTFPEVWIHDFFIDPSGSLWLSTNGMGLLKVKPKPIQMFEIPSVPIAWNVSLLNHHQLIVGTFGNGLYSLRDGKFERDLRWNQLNNSKIGFTTPYKNGLLIGTIGNGLWKMGDDLKIERLHESRTHDYLNDVTALYVEGDSIFAGTNDGVGLIHKGKVIDYNQVFVPTVMTMTKWNQEVLVGFYTYGLFKIFHDSLTHISIPELTGSSINYLAVDSSNRLWIASNRNYLLVLEKFNAQPKIIKLNVGGINFLSFIGNNHVLVGTEGSVYLFGLDNSLKVVSRREFNHTDGFIRSGSSNCPPVVQDSVVWFTTTKGVCKLDLKYLSQNSHDAMVYIDKITIRNNDSIPTNWYASMEGFYKIPKGLRLPHYANEVKISFFVHDYNPGGSIGYRYRLDPIDQEWTYTSTPQEINYTNLRPDQYYFRVEAQRDDLKWGSTSEYTFEIIPAFWQTKLFLSAITIITLLVIFILFRYYYSYRIQKLKREERIREEAATKIREQVSMDFHDELGNKLASIVAHANALRLKHVAGDHHLLSILNYMEENAKQIYEGTRDFIWAIDTKSNNLEEVAFYIKDFGDRLFSKNDINFFLTQNISEQDSKIYLKDGQGRHLVLFCKEALTNVFKHAKCGNVWLKIFYDNRDIYITIEDDGVGMENNAREGNGLRNMKKRADRIGGTFKHRSPKGKGVIIELTFQL